MAILGNPLSKVEVVLNQFGKDVYDGLSSKPKFLSSKYFYDEIGDQIFVEIMKMPEYYLTNCEFEILSEQGEEIRKAFAIEGEEFELIELGAGDGTKTIELLRAFEKDSLVYKPIDISPFAISNLKDRLETELPWLSVKGEQGEYFKVLKDLKNDKKKIVLFLGSNIGNLLDEQSKDFIAQLSMNLKSGDCVLLGVDLKKDPSIILPAYNDPHGHSRSFNLNLLQRINKELLADFNLHNFEHRPKYDQEAGIALSYIESLVDQEVRIESLNESFMFEKGELIHTEVSRKYDDTVIADIVSESGLKVKRTFTDKKGYFSDYLLMKT
ncbi:MAG: L-histidine N(alpha)-methyltransferase [Bacteroidota bacterium]